MTRNARFNELRPIETGNPNDSVSTQWFSCECKGNVAIFEFYLHDFHINPS